MIIYLTSLNKDKISCCNNIKDIFKNVEIKSIKSDSRIKGGQPYGLKETKQACINRTYKFKNNDIKIVENLELNPILRNISLANSFEISGQKLYVGIFTEDKEKVIKVFDLKTGLQISKIILSREK